MKPFKSTTMLRPLNDAELQLEDPQREDDDTVTFYIPCWFNVDLFFSGLHVVTDENDDYINLYCAYNTKTHGVRLFFTYANNSGAEEGEQDFEVEVAMDPATAALLQDKVSAWLKPEQREKTVWSMGRELSRPCSTGVKQPIDQERRAEIA